MLISVDVTAFYEWEPAADGVEPTRDEIAQLLYKPDAAGGWLQKILVEADTHTDVNIPESELDDLIRHKARKGVKWDRVRAAHHYLEEHVMPHHAPVEGFVHVHVHDEPELEAKLNVMFGTAGRPSGGPAPSGAGNAAGARARAMRRSHEGAHSHFLSSVYDEDGRLKSRGSWRHNLTTDTAVGYTNRRDWQAKAMGGGLGAFFGATATGFATSTDATHLNNTGAAFPTASQGLAGYLVAAGPNNAGVGSTVFGVITANTGIQLTVDQWYNPATGAAGTTPNGTCSYVVLPGQMPAMFLALTADAVAPSSADTTLASESILSGLTRKLATWAHTAAATTFTLTGIFNAGAALVVNKEAVFAAANVTGGGAMPFESVEPTPPNLLSGDQLSQTITITIN